MINMGTKIKKKELPKHGKEKFGRLLPPFLKIAS